MTDTKKIMTNTKKSGSLKHHSMSRFEMLQWVNDMVQGEYTKIENLCSGVAYCQMLAKIFPYSIQLRRVKINPKIETEYIHNLRLLQDAFIRLELDKLVPIDRLIQGRFKHNFEFLQWFRKFYDSNMPQLDVKKPAVKPFKSRFSFKGKSPTNKPDQKKQPFARASVIKPIKPPVKKQFPIETPELEEKQTLPKVAVVKPRIIPKEESPMPMNFKKPSELIHRLTISDENVQAKLQCTINVRDLSYRKLLMIEKIVKTNDVGIELMDIFDRINAVLAAPMNDQDSDEDNQEAGNPADTAAPMNDQDSYEDNEGDGILADTAAPMNDQDSAEDNEEAGIPADTAYFREDEIDAVLAAELNGYTAYLINDQDSAEVNEEDGILADTAAPMNDQDSAEDSEDDILADTAYFHGEEINAVLAAAMNGYAAYLMNDQDSAEVNEGDGIMADTAAPMNDQDSAEDNEDGILADTAYFHEVENNAVLAAPINDQDSAEDNEGDGILADTAAPMNGQDIAEDNEGNGILADTAAPMNDQDSAEDNEGADIPADTAYFHEEEINAVLTNPMNDQDSAEANEGAGILVDTAYFHEENMY